MAKRTPLTRIIILPEETVSPRERQLAALRGRIKGSDAYLAVVAELAFGADRSGLFLTKARP